MQKQLRIVEECSVYCTVHKIKGLHATAHQQKKDRKTTSVCVFKSFSLLHILNYRKENRMNKNKISWVMSLTMQNTVIKCISCAVFNHRVYVIHHKNENSLVLNVLCYAKLMPSYYCLLFNWDTPPPTLYSLQSSKILPADVLKFNRISDAVSAYIMHNHKVQSNVCAIRKLWNEMVYSEIDSWSQVLMVAMIMMGISSVEYICVRRS